MKKLFTKKQTSEELRTPFKYEPLEGTEIRLLRLHSFFGHGFAKILSGSLQTIRLQDDNIFVSTQFEALSYFWGTETADRTLSLDNTPFSIKPNLETALLELSKGSVERLLWIDAVCINQADLNERNEQVRKMRSIYRQAVRVIIWIGPRWEGKSAAADAIQEFAQEQRRGADSQHLSTFLDNPHNHVKTQRHSYWFSDFPEVKAVDYDYTGGYWPVLVDFFDRPWWRRVWVRYVLGQIHVSFKSAVPHLSRSQPVIES